MHTLFIHYTHNVYNVKDDHSEEKGETKIMGVFVTDFTMDLDCFVLD